MIPRLGLVFTSLQVPLNKCFGWDWVLLFLFCFINLLGESRRWWKQKLRAKPPLEHIFFLLSSKPTNPSSGPQGLLVSVAVPSVSKVGRRPGKEVGQVARLFGGTRQVRAQARRAALGRAPRCASPRGNESPRRPSRLARAPPVAPPDPPRPPGPQVASGLRPATRAPAPGSSRSREREEVAEGGRGERELGLTSRPRSHPGGGRDGGDAGARPAVGSAAGRLQTPCRRCRAAVRREEAAECGRRG